MLFFGTVLQRYSTGVAGLLLRGNVCVQTVVARSCMPVGPLSTVTEVAGPTRREIMTVQRATTDADAATALPQSPLEQLEDVINEVVVMLYHHIYSYDIPSHNIRS